MSDNLTPRDGHVDDPSAPGDANSGYVPPHLRPPPSSKPGRRRKRKSFVRRHKILLSLGVVLTLTLTTACGYLYWLNHQLDSIAKVDAGIQTDPDKQGGKEKGQPLNILLLGADNGSDSESVEEDLEDGEWTPFIHRSDTLMIAHIPADRKSVQLVSIPRDTWVPIKDYPYSGGQGKINAAFAFGGPETAIDTVEQLTNIPIDHLAIIDWRGFKDLSTALGGVRVYIPETFYDDSQKITWEKGWHTYEGQEALAYVRTRHGLENGDFDRIARQQNFMRATMGELLGSTKNVVAMTKVVNVITKYLTIDSTWDNDEIRNLALSMRGIKSKDVQFMMAPFGRFDTSDDGQSIVRLAPEKSKALFESVIDDDVQSYIDRYPKSVLKDDKSVG
jgi:LCP family protein required for cell wall assembly